MQVVDTGSAWSSLSHTQYAVCMALAVLLLVNLKGVLGVWHLRLFKGLFTQYILAARDKKSKRPTPTATPDDASPDDPNQATSGHDTDPTQPPARLFSYLVTAHRNAAIDCDYNMHKSNSTFFADLDINRAQLLIRLFGGFPRWTPPTPLDDKEKHEHKDKKTEKSLNVALGGTSCVFKREIKPLQRFEIWSRVAGWDGKWLYVASYFVNLNLKPGVEYDKAILASSLSRYVFKDGRVTVKPRDVLGYNGLLVTEAGKGEDGDGEGLSGKLEAARLFDALDALPQQFEPGRFGVLGRYADL
ncbi:hypothetical protein BDW74DRAFT_180443 [Aspergillus multicolor]|uniref:acyl-CoA thioesterase n=1 Tax=Aspergillus multicolor TaxID=41759 RepID=UPI003CCD7CAC